MLTDQQKLIVSDELDTWIHDNQLDPAQSPAALAEDITSNSDDPDDPFFLLLDSIPPGLDLGDDVDAYLTELITEKMPLILAMHRVTWALYDDAHDAISNCAMLDFRPGVPFSTTVRNYLTNVLVDFALADDPTQRYSISYDEYTLDELKTDLKLLTHYEMCHSAIWYVANQLRSNYGITNDSPDSFL